MSNKAYIVELLGQQVENEMAAKAFGIQQIWEQPF